MLGVGGDATDLVLRRHRPRHNTPRLERPGLGQGTLLKFSESLDVSSRHLLLHVAVTGVSISELVTPELSLTLRTL